MPNTPRDLRRLTNIDDLLPPPPAARTDAQPLPEAPPAENPFQQRSTVDPLEANLARVDMLGALRKKDVPSWAWWTGVVLFGLPPLAMVLALVVQMVRGLVAHGIDSSNLLPTLLQLGVLVGASVLFSRMLWRSK